MSVTLLENRRGLTKLLWLANLLFALVLGVGIWVSYQQHLQSITEKAENTSLALERSLSGTLENINLMLTSVGDDLEAGLVNGQVDIDSANRLIARLIRTLPNVGVLRYSDAAGQVVTNAGYPAGSPAINIQDRDYFQWLRDHPDVELFSSKPVFGRTLNKWVVAFVRPYRYPDGRFAGVVYAAIDMSRFSDMFAAIRLGPRARIVLLDQDYARMAAHPLPSDPAVLGRRMDQEAVIQQLQTGITTLTATFTTKLDQVERLYSIHKLASRPYWIAVGVSVDDELAPWRRQTGMALFVMLVFGALTGAAGRQLQQVWRRQEESMLMLQSTLEATDNGILVVDGAGRVMHSNQRFALMWRIPTAMLAHGDEKAMLNHVLDQLSDPQGFMRHIEAVYGNPVTEVIDTLEFKDGRVFERMSRPVLRNGQPAARVWSFRDTSERRRIYDLLNFVAQRDWAATQREFLPALAERLGQLLRVDYVIIDRLADAHDIAETVGLYAHGAVAPNLRYPLAGTPCENVMGKEMCLYRENIQQLFPADALLVDMKAESYLGVPLWDAAGRPIGLIAVLDSKPLENGDQAQALIKLVATAAGAELERQREEIVLRRERDRAQGYLDTVESMIIALDAEGRITQANRKSCQLLGWKENDLLGQSWFARCLPQPHGMDVAYPTFLKIIRGERADNMNYVEHDVLTRSGEVRRIAWNNAVLRDDNGEIVGSLSSGEDITERKLRDEELDGYRHRLEELVALRTHELATAKEQAESSNRAKSVFLANMSHELRTPLNAILGFARLLERDADMGEENRRKLVTINRSGQHLLALINDVLEISRIEAGRCETRTTSFALDKVLGELEDMTRPRTEEKGLAFELQRAPDLPSCVLGDPHLLKQILINLLGNAAKYTDLGSVHLRVRPVNGQINFDVIDTGPGINAEDREKIFQAFYQTEVGIAKGEGTGLGLSISRQYARMMGGELSVTSQAGQGSVFSLSVPLATGDADAAQPSRHRGAIIGLEAGIKPPRILVVDDQASNRELVAQILEVAGLDVQLAENGAEAVNAFVNWQPQLIWMDMRMPVMDGYEATRQIRALPGGDQVKIVALTASAFEEDRQDILGAGCDDLVRKPFEEDRLFGVMGKLLELRYRRAEKDVAEPAPSAASAAELDISGVSFELRMRLKTAAELLDLATVRQIIKQIKSGHAELGNGLEFLLDGFRFDLIKALCENSPQLASAARTDADLTTPDRQVPL